MTRDEAIFAVATAHGLAAMPRGALLGLLGDASERPGMMVVTEPQAASAARGGVSERTVRREVQTLEAAGVVCWQGRALVVDCDALPAWLAAQAATQAAQAATQAAKAATEAANVVRTQTAGTEAAKAATQAAKAATQAAKKPSRVRAPDSLLAQDSKESFAVAAAAASVREYESGPARALDPEIPMDPGAPSSLTPPPPFVSPAWPLDDEPSVPSTSSGRSDFAVAQAAWCDAMTAVQLIPGWDDAIARELAAHDLAWVLAGAARLKTYLTGKPTPLLVAARRDPTWCAEQCDSADKAAAAARGAPQGYGLPGSSSAGAYARDRALATRNAPMVTDLAILNADRVGQAERNAALTAHWSKP